MSLAIANPVHVVLNQRPEYCWDSLDRQDFKGADKEIFSGTLTLLTTARTGSRSGSVRQFLFVQVYRTSKGKLAIFWPENRRQIRPFGCLYLRDTVVTKSLHERLAFHVRPRITCDYDSQTVLTFLCNTIEEVQQWQQAFSTSCASPRRYTSTVTRLPSLEEEP